MKECIGFIEFSSVALGIEATDSIVKEAPVKIVVSRAVSPGKWIILFRGDVESVRFALSSAKRKREDSLVDEIIIPNVHHDVITALGGSLNVDNFTACGIIETYSLATVIEAADIAAKKADVKLITIRLGTGLGGKGYFIIGGEVSDVEESINAAADYCIRKNVLAKKVIIPQAHPDLKSYLC